MPIIRMGDTRYYTLCEYENNCLIIDGNGYYLDKNKMLEVATKIINTSTDEVQEQIEIANSQIRDEYSKLYEKLNSRDTTENMESFSYVYLMECGGKYKIGISRDVERRAKQLDNRPFPVNVICKSAKIKHAETAEEQLHKKYNEHRIGGEWFEFDESTITEIISTIQSLR